MKCVKMVTDLNGLVYIYTCNLIRIFKFYFSIPFPSFKQTLVDLFLY